MIEQQVKPDILAESSMISDGFASTTALADLTEEEQLTANFKLPHSFTVGFLGTRPVSPIRTRLLRNP